MGDSGNMVKWKNSVAFALEAFEQIKIQESHLERQWLAAHDRESRDVLRERLADIKAQAVTQNAQIVALLGSCPAQCAGLPPVTSQAWH